MTTTPSIDPALAWDEHIDRAEPDLLRGADEDVRASDHWRRGRRDLRCAPYDVRSDERINSRNGYRPREWDTRVGTMELAIPKLRLIPTSRTGSCSAASVPNGP